MIVVKMRDENGGEPERANFLVIEADVGKRMAVSAKGILEDGIERDPRPLAFEDVPRMEDARDRERSISIRVRIGVYLRPPGLSRNRFFRKLGSDCARRNHTACRG